MYAAAPPVTVTAEKLADAIRGVHQGLRVVDPQLAQDAWGEADPLTDRERQVLRAAEVKLDVTFPSRRATVEECARAFELIASGQAKTVRDVLTSIPAERRRAVELGLLWLAKYGYIDWPTPEAG